MFRLTYLVVLLTIVIPGKFDHVHHPYIGKERRIEIINKTINDLLIQRREEERTKLPNYQAVVQHANNNPRYTIEVPSTSSHTSTVMAKLIGKLIGIAAVGFAIKRLFGSSKKRTSENSQQSLV